MNQGAVAPPARVVAHLPLEAWRELVPVDRWGPVERVVLDGAGWGARAAWSAVVVLAAGAATLAALL